MQVVLGGCAGSTRSVKFYFKILVLVWFWFSLNLVLALIVLKEGGELKNKDDAGGSRWLCRQHQNCGIGQILLALCVL